MILLYMSDSLCKPTVNSEFIKHLVVFCVFFWGEGEKVIFLIHDRYVYLRGGGREDGAGLF